MSQSSTSSESLCDRPIEIENDVFGTDIISLTELQQNVTATKYINTRIARASIDENANKIDNAAIYAPSASLSSDASSAQSDDELDPPLTATIVNEGVVDPVFVRIMGRDSWDNFMNCGTPDIQE